MTPTVCLRSPELSDITFLYEWENDTSIWHLGSVSAPLSRFMLEQYIINSSDDIYVSRQVRFMIDHVRKGKSVKTVGAIDLFDFDPKNMRAGVGILISNGERKKGLALAGLKALLSYAFEVVGMKQVWAGIPAGNMSSLKLFEEAGFTRSGIRKEWIKRGEGWEDEYIYQLIRK